METLSSNETGFELFWVGVYLNNFSCVVFKQNIQNYIHFFFLTDKSFNCVLLIHGTKSKQEDISISGINKWNVNHRLAALIDRDLDNLMHILYA